MFDQASVSVLPNEGEGQVQEPSRDGLKNRGRQPRRSVAPRTARQYEVDWSAFRNWCADHGHSSLPAMPPVVAAYLTERSARLGWSGLRLILAALAHHHRQAGVPWAGGDPAIATLLRKHRQPTRPAAALNLAELDRMLDCFGPDLAGVRDRALLLTGFAGALRRSDIVALDHEDLRFTTDGLVLRLRSAESGREEQGVDVSLARVSGPGSCPVHAMEAWLRRARIEYGPVFRRLTGSGTIEDRLTGNGVWKILRRRAETAGLTVRPGERLSPHSLRTGRVAKTSGGVDEQAGSCSTRKNLSTDRHDAATAAASPVELLGR